MAAKDDLSEQSKLTAQIAASMRDMAATAAALKSSYSEQVDIIEKLAKAFTQIDTSQAASGLDALNKVLSDTSSKAQNTGKLTETTLKRLNKSVDEAGKTIGQKFPKSVLIATGALAKFGQGIKNVLNFNKSLIGLTAKVVEGLGSIAISIASIPFKMFEGLVDMAAKSGMGMSELMVALEKMRKQFGAWYAPTNKAIIDVSRSMKGFSDTGLSTWRVFGNMAERLEYISEIAKEMGGSFSSLRKEIEDNGGAILGYQKGLGILNEDMKGVMKRGVAEGKTFASLAKDMTKYSYEIGSAFGLDPKLISRDVSKAMTDVKHFGGATVKAISEASVYARKLGFELKDITGALDAFDTFDTAADNAAKLSQSFGVNIDAFEMMKAQNPAEQMEVLRKSFRAAGVDASKFGRAELKLAAQTTGLSEDVVQSALSLKNQGVSLDQIKKKSGEAEKKTLTQQQAMSKLADAIERLVKSGSLMGGFWDMFFKGILNGLMSTREFYGLMLNIKQALMQVMMIGVKLGRQLMTLIPGFQEIFSGLREFFEPKKFAAMFKGVSDAVTRYLGDKDHPGHGSVQGLFADLHETIKNMFSVEGSSGKKILDGFKKFFLFMSDLISKAIVWMSDKVANGIVSMVSIINDPKKLMAGGKGVLGGAMGFAHQVFDPIVDSLKFAVAVIGPQLKILAKTLWDKLLAFLQDHKKEIKTGINVLMAELFGPSLMYAILAAVAKGAATGLATQGVGLIAKLMGPAKKAADAALLTNAVPKITNPLPDASVTQAIGTSAQAAQKAGAGISWANVGKFFVGFAGVVAIGLVAVLAAVAAIRHWKITNDELKDALLLVAGSALAMLPAAIPIMVLSKFKIDPKAAAMGIGAMALGILAMVTTIGLIMGGLALAGAKASDMVPVANMIMEISKVFLMTGVVVLAAMGIGALLAIPGAGLAAVAGFGAMSLAIGAMTTSIIAIMTALNGVPMNDDLKPKVEMFATLMKGIQAFADTFVNLVGMMQPTFIEFLTGKTSKFAKKAEAATELINSLIGSRDSGKGIIGIVDCVVNALTQFNFAESMKDKAQIFSSVMMTVADVLKAMTPPPEFYSATGGFFAKLADPTNNFATLTENVTKYITTMQGSMMKLLKGDNPNVSGGGIIGILEELSTINVDATKASGVASLMQTLTSLIQAITPSDSMSKAFRNLSKTGTDGTFESSLTQTSTIDTGAMATYYDKIKEVMLAIVPTLTSDVMDNMLKKAKDISKDPKQFEALNAIASVMKSIVDLAHVAIDLDGKIPKGGIPVGGLIELSTNLPVIFDKLIDVMNVVDKKVGIGNDLTKFQSRMNSLATLMKGDGKKGSGVTGALMAVSEMVNQANKLNEALSSDMNKIDINAKLSNVASAVGLQGGGTYTVNPSKQVQVVVNLTVTMNAGDVEKAIISNQKSIIADRLNFATENPSSKGNDKITPGSAPQFPMQPSVKH